MKRAAIAIFTAATLASASACSHETEPAPVSQETFLQESIDEATLRSGHSNVITVDITFAPTDFNVRETPQRNLDPYDNLCGEIGGLVLEDAVVVVSPGHPDWDGDWVAIPNSATENKCSGVNGWVNGGNIDEIKFNQPDGSTVIYSANDLGQFQQGETTPRDALPAGSSWEGLWQISSVIAAKQTRDAAQ